MKWDLRTRSGWIRGGTAHLIRLGLRHTGASWAGRSGLGAGPRGVMVIQFVQTVLVEPPGKCRVQGQELGNRERWWEVWVKSCQITLTGSLLLRAGILQERPMDVQHPDVVEQKEKGNGKHADLGAHPRPAKSESRECRIYTGRKITHFLSPFCSFLRIRFQGIFGDLFVHVCVYVNIYMNILWKSSN